MRKEFKRENMRGKDKMKIQNNRQRTKLDKRGPTILDLYTKIIREIYKGKSISGKPNESLIWKEPNRQGLREKKPKASGK